MNEWQWFQDLLLCLVQDLMKPACSLHSQAYTQLRPQLDGSFG